MYVNKIWFSPVLLAVLTVVSVVLPGRSVRAEEADAPTVAEAGVMGSNAIALNSVAPETLGAAEMAIAPEKVETLLYPSRQASRQASRQTVAVATTPTDISTPEVFTLEVGAIAPTAPSANDEKIEGLLSQPRQNASTPSRAADLPTVLAQTPTSPAPSPLPALEEEAEDPRVLVAEVAVSGVGGELEQAIYNAISTVPGQTTSRSQLQEDVNAIFATGFFSRAEAVPSDTPLGVRITFVVQSNPVLQSVQIPGSQVVPPEVIAEIFEPEYNSVINLNQLQDDVDDLMQWYQDNGYVLAQILDVPQINDNGVVTLLIAEGVIEDIQVQFLDEEGELFDENGEPVRGRTRDFIITREFESQPGDVFNQQQIESDLRRAFDLGIFEDLRVSLNPGQQDPRQVNVVVNVLEGQTGSIAAGVGVSSASGLFGTVSYQERNIGGNNQRISAEVQLGERDLLFDVSFTDPWIATDPNRTSYTVNAFSRRSVPLVFQGGDTEVFLPNGDRPRVRRLGGGVRFGRPLENGWTASLGLQYQNIRLQDIDGDLAPEDELGNDLSFSGDGTDDLILLQLFATQDRRNSVASPTSGSLLRLSTEQSIPIGSGSILLNRLRASYSYFIPVDFTSFSDEGAETLAFNIQGGVVLGDLPPYEAFSLGGTDSVRGYDSGEVGSGRAFVLGSVEYRFPLFSILGGALFVDFGTDLGTGSNVPGRPAEIRDKPGTGFGYGLGVRIQSPIGAVRIDYGFNDEGDGRIHFGIGERF